MLSVIIEADRRHDALARTLTCLVAGAIEGIIREVIVCDAENDPQTQIIADHMGCLYLNGSDLCDGISHSTNEWLLLLEPGARLIEGWGEAIVLHMEQERAAGRFSLSQHVKHPFWARLFRPRSPLEYGLLISRQQTKAGAGLTARDIVRQAGRVKTLNAQIIPASK